MDKEERYVKELPYLVHLNVIGPHNSGLTLNNFCVGDLKAQPLTVAHQGGSNQNEVERIAREHPGERVHSLLRNGGRMLGELAPSRAFGDVRYKWPAELLLQMAEFFGAEVPVRASSIVPMGQWAGHTALASPYTSPPYLSSRPDVTVHQVPRFFFVAYLLKQIICEYLTLYEARIAR